MAEFCDGTEEQCLKRAAQLLNAGSCVALPTETVYGLAARYDVEEAVHSVFRLKGRPNDNPLIVHVASIAQAAQVGDVSNTVVRSLMDAFWPGPLTIVVPKVPSVLSAVTAGLPTVAIRCPAHDVFRTILQSTGPLVAPSANVSGRPSPTTAAHVLHDFANADVLVVDGGECQVGLESTVVHVNNSTISILRPGDITSQQLARYGTVAVQSQHNAENAIPMAPGMKYRHYAPDAEVVLLSTVAEAQQFTTHARDTCMLLIETNELQNLVTEERTGWKSVRELHQHSLYSNLRDADALGITMIVCVCTARIRENEALMNRLQKAQSKR